MTVFYLLQIFLRFCQIYKIKYCVFFDFVYVLLCFNEFFIKKSKYSFSNIQKTAKMSILFVKNSKKMLILHRYKRIILNLYYKFEN